MRAALIPLAAALAVAATAGPASADPPPAPKPPIRCYPRPEPSTGCYQDLRNPDTADVVAGRWPVIQMRRGGFDWGDAAIGAGGATGMLAISAPAALGLRHR
jgi:hypothetical protein